MAKKQKCECPKPGLSAPFYMTTYGDLMTLLMCFFVLLFAMSTIETIKFQAQVSIMQGALGISKFYHHAPMQQHLPAPSLKQQNPIMSRAKVSPVPSQTTSRSDAVNSSLPLSGFEEDTFRAIKSLGTAGDLEIREGEDGLVLVLPSYSLFKKGEFRIDPNSPEVLRVKPLYRELAKQISTLISYDIYFTGHTDSLPVIPKGSQFPKNNMELGFLRAVNTYNFFFKEDVRDLTRVTFASQGDNVPLVPNASLDSELRKNRRIEIHLKKRK